MPGRWLRTFTSVLAVHLSMCSSVRMYVRLRVCSLPMHITESCRFQPPAARCVGKSPPPASNLVCSSRRPMRTVNPLICAFLADAVYPLPNNLRVALLLAFALHRPADVCIFVRIGLQRIARSRTAMHPTNHRRRSLIGHHVLLFRLFSSPQ